MTTLQRPAHSFQVGDRVRVPLGQRHSVGVIVEDHGAIGVDRRRLLRVQEPMEPFEPLVLVVPEEELEPVADNGQAPTALYKAKIIDYLANGGLISILRSNLLGGKSQPRVWLCLDNLGNVTHTFLAERGLIGGETVPFGAAHEDKVFTPKQITGASPISSIDTGFRRPVEV